MHYDWYDRAIEELEEDLENNVISYKEFVALVKELNEEYYEYDKTGI